MENSSIVSFRVSTKLDTGEDASFWSRVKMVMRTRRAMAAVSTVVVALSILAMWFSGVFSLEQPISKSKSEDESSNQVLRWIFRHQKGLIIGILALMAVVAGSVSLYYINRRNNGNNTMASDSESEQEDDKRTVWYGLLFAVLGFLVILMVLYLAQWWRERKWMARMEKKKPFVLFHSTQKDADADQVSEKKILHLQPQKRQIWVPYKPNDYARKASKQKDSMVVKSDDLEIVPQIDKPTVPSEQSQEQPFEEAPPKAPSMEKSPNSTHFLPDQDLAWDDSLIRQSNDQERPLPVDLQPKTIPDLMAPATRSPLQDDTLVPAAKNIGVLDEKMKSELSQSDHVKTINVLPKLEVDLYDQLKFYMSQHQVHIKKSDLAKVSLNTATSGEVMTDKFAIVVYDAVESGKKVKNVRGILFRYGSDEENQEIVHKAEQQILQALPTVQCDAKITSIQPPIDCYADITSMHSCMNAVFTLIPYMVNKANANALFTKKGDIEEVSCQKNINLFNSTVEHIYNAHLLLSGDGKQVVPLNHFVMPPTLKIMQEKIVKNRFETANLISLLLKTQGQMPIELLKPIPYRLLKSVLSSHVNFKDESKELSRYEWTWIIYVAMTLIEENPPRLLKDLTLPSTVDGNKPSANFTPITLSGLFPSKQIHTTFEYTPEMDDVVKLFGGTKSTFGWMGANKFTLFRHFENLSVQHYQDLENFENNFMTKMGKRLGRFTTIDEVELFMRQVQAALTHVTFWEDGQIYSIADQVGQSVEVDQYVDFADLFNEPLLQYIQAAVYTLSKSSAPITIDTTLLTKFSMSTFLLTRTEASQLYFYLQSPELCNSDMCTNLSRVRANRPHRRALHWILYFAYIIAGQKQLSIN